MAPTSVIIDGFLIMFGPSCVGFIVLLLTSIYAEKFRSVVVASVVAVLLHLLSVLVLSTLAGMGHAWGGSESSMPQTYCAIGFAVLAVPPLARLGYDSHRSSK